MVTPKKECELDVVLKLLSLGKTKAEIRKKLDLKPSALANRLRRLEDLGCIERKGKYIINVLRSSHKNPRVTKNQVHIKLNKRGHAHNFKIYFPKETNLKEKPKVKNEKKQKTLEELPFGSLKFIKKKYTIWINKDTLTIYSNNSYYSDNALHSKFQALKDVDNLVQELKYRFGFSGVYGIEVFREHYGLIFNKFAKWILNKKRKLYVKEKGNKTILWVDNSRKDDQGLEEFEADDPIRANTADNYFESHDKTGWKVTPEKVLEMFDKTGNLIQKNAEQLEYYGENMVSHVAVMKRIDKKLDHMDSREERLIKAIERLARK